MANSRNSSNPVITSADPIFRPLGRKNAYEEVGEQIRRLILSHKLRPSHRLPTERDLAQQFGVSRVVVREAIRTLEHSGLLTVKKGPRGGIFVAQQYDRPIANSIVNLLAGGEASLENLFEIRLLIEPFAAFRAAELATQSELDEVRAILHRGTSAAENYAQVRSHNIEFHRAILRMCHNPVVAVVGDAVFQILSHRIKGVISAKTTVAALGMHQKIFEALRKRQATKAESLMRQDIQATGRRFSELAPEMLAQLIAQH